MNSIVKQRKIWFTLSGGLVILSIALIAIFGLNFGIDFKGGALMEIEFSPEVTRPSASGIDSALSTFKLGAITTQPAGDNSIILRFAEINEQAHQEIITTLNSTLRPEGFDGPLFEEIRFDSIGPSIGEELKQKTYWAIGLVLIAIIIYVAWAFRKVSQPISSWKYGLIATVALFHDVTITVGVFVILGKMYNIEINAPFIAAILTVLGYSVNDTIVVFDRIRENLLKRFGADFEEVVSNSISEVMTRSINTSLTTLLVLFSILLLGGATVRDFVLTLIIGISVGTYSSIFLASPLLVTWEKFRSKK